MASATEIIQRRKRRQSREAASQRRLRLWGGIVIGLFGLLFVLPAGVALAGTAVMYGQAVRDLPEPLDTIYLDPAVGATELYDRSGSTLLFTVTDPLGDARTWIGLDTLPPYVVEATLAAEDPHFLSAAPPGLPQELGQLWANALYGPLEPDPSLTARLVRNAIAPPGAVATVADREREIALTAEINRRYSREQILEWHLNTNYYGSEAYGIDAAARVYLNKRAADLTLDETALLAAIPPAPQYNPFDNETAARGRQDDVLRALAQRGAITALEYDLAVTTATAIQADGGQTPEVAPEFALYARRQAQAILDSLGKDGARLVARGGLRLVTTLDLDLYYETECALRAHLARLNGKTPPTTAADGGPCASAALLPPVSAAAGASPPDSGALVVIDVATGEIKSMVGPVAAAAYQPGPVLQPFVYFEGLRVGGLHAATMVLDIPRPFPGAVEGLIYTPANADGQFRGPLNLRDAMSSGLLPPAVWAANRQRIENILRGAHLIGINSLDENARYDLSLLERGGEVAPLDVTYAYSVFAGMGSMRGVPVQPLGRSYRGRDPVAVLRIEDAAGEVLWEYAGDTYEPDCAAATNCTPVFQGELAYLVNDILADQGARARVLGGAAEALNVSRRAAVAAGITGDDRDSWAVGYTPQLAVGVHLGRADQAALTLDSFGLDGAAPVWNAVMRYAHEALPAADWPRPDNIIEGVVCERSGLLPNDACPVRRELFIENIQPRQADTFWQTVEVNNQTGQLATSSTPAGLVSERVYFVPPSDALDWWEANNLPLPPTEFDTVSRPGLLGAAAILEPASYAYVGGVVDIRGSLDPTNMQFYQLAFGRGLNPEEWVQIGPQQTSYARGASLGQWDTSGLDGLYSLRLTVVMNDNSVESDVRQVSVDNVAPQITLTAGEPGQVFLWPDERVIALAADVADNLAVSRVEFYYNGTFIGTDTEWPYGFEWTIQRTGTERFSAVAFDAIGNQASSEVEVEVRRAGS